MNTPELLKNLRDSEIYLAFVTNSFLSDCYCIAQWEYAKTLKKPFIILKHKNCVIPEDMLEDVNVIDTIIFTENNDSVRYELEKAFDKFGKIFDEEHKRRIKCHSQSMKH